MEIVIHWIKFVCDFHNSRINPRAMGINKYQACQFAVESPAGFYEFAKTYFKSPSPPQKKGCKGLTMQLFKMFCA
jgi:hypothetical protein